MGENIYKASGVIIAFLVSILIMQVAFGDKVAQKYTLLALFIVLLAQTDTLSGFFSDLISGNSSNDNNGQSTIHSGAGGREYGGGGRGF